MNLSKRAAFQPSLSYASGATTRNGDPIDVRGSAGVAFFVSVHSAMATGAASYKIQGGNASDLSDAVDLEGLSVALMSPATDDGTVKVFDIATPPFRYLRVVAVKDGTNATAESAIAAPYSKDREPVTKDEYTDVIFAASPAAVS